MEQVRAKAFLIRDLEELRAKKYTAENLSTLVFDDRTKIEFTDEGEPLQVPNALPSSAQPTPELVIKEENVIRTSPEQIVSAEDEKHPILEDPPKDSIAKAPDETKPVQALSPPNSSRDTNNPILTGLDINTTAAAGTESPAPTTTGLQESSINSLFGIPDDENTSSNIDFDAMDFSLHIENTNTQNPEQSETETQQFDLSTFGNISQDVNPSTSNVPDLEQSNESNSGNNPQIAPTNNQGEYLDGLSGDLGEHNINDMMDLDIDIDLDRGEYDDIFFGTGDGGSGGTMDELRHGEFDDAFFGIE